MNIHLYQYLKGDVYPNDSYDKRAKLYKAYNSSKYNVNKWIENNLSLEEQEYYKQYLLQDASFDSREFSFQKLAKEQAQQTRKDETDAIVSQLRTIRAKSNFRWNQMKRLRDAFHQQINKIENDSLPLPIEFYYDEPEHIGERFRFRLWDKPSFVLNHQIEFSNGVIKRATQRKLTYSDENKAYFLEFICAKSLEGVNEAEGFWFNDLIKQNVLGQWKINNPIEEHDRILKFLSCWGYQNENQQNPIPFSSMHKGILTPSKFVTKHKDKVEGLLIDVEPLYVLVHLDY